MMSPDLTRILQQWQFNPDEIVVRLIRGEDGRDKLQLRVDLGILQMELSGRPDGLRPEDCQSWLDYHEARQKAHEAECGEETPFLLSEEACQQLWREGIQYYHRYLSCWQLKLYELCARDTARNLRLFRFVCEHTRDERQKLQFDQWRPYVTMMHARSVATPLVERQRFDEGLKAIEAGIDAIRDFLEEYQQTERASECPELVSLEGWREEILAQEESLVDADADPSLRVLRRKLDRAVAAEQFEEAARLRDQIKRFGSL